MLSNADYILYAIDRYYLKNNDTLVVRNFLIDCVPTLN